MEDRSFLPPILIPCDSMASKTRQYTLFTASNGYDYQWLPVRYCEEVKFHYSILDYQWLPESTLVGKRVGSLSLFTSRLSMTFYESLISFWTGFNLSKLKARRITIDRNFSYVLWKNTKLKLTRPQAGCNLKSRKPYSVLEPSIRNIHIILSIPQAVFPAISAIIEQGWLLNERLNPKECTKPRRNQYQKLVSNRSPNSSVPKPHSPFDWERYEWKKLLQIGFVKSTKKKASAI